MEWIEPWHLIDIDKQELFNVELQKELHSAHILFNTKLNAIAKSSENDDVLYSFTDETFRVAEVCLTWKGSAETFRFPVSIIYCSLEKWKSFVLYEDVLPLVDHSNTICMLGYFLMDHIEYEDYFKWAESLVEQGYSFKELDILLSYSLDANIQASEFLDIIKKVFKEIGYEPDQTKQSLFIFMSYLCDRIVLNITELDDVVKIFREIDQIFGDEFTFLSEWARLRIDLYNIYTFEETVYFEDWSLKNYQLSAVNFAMKFKKMIQNKL